MCFFHPTSAVFVVRGAVLDTETRQKKMNQKKRLDCLQLWGQIILLRWRWRHKPTQIRRRNAARAREPPHPRFARRRSGSATAGEVWVMNLKPINAKNRTTNRPGKRGLLCVDYSGFWQTTDTETSISRFKLQYCLTLNSGDSHCG